MIPCTRALLASMLLLTTLHGQEPAQTVDARSLVDPAVMQAADGAFHRTRIPALVPGIEEAYMPAIEPSSHAPNLLRLRNGDALLFWYTGTWEGDSGVAVVVSRLAAGAQRWTPPQVIDRADGKAYMNPVAFQDARGEVHLFHTDQPAKQPQQTSHLLQSTSTDNGRTWSKPTDTNLGTGVFTGHSPIEADDGSWLLPVSFQPADAQPIYSSIARSIDAGRSWRLCPIADSDGKSQPSLIRTPGGFAAFLRSRAADHIYEATSQDGCTWTGMHATALPNNNSSVEVLRLRDGRWLMAYNDAHAGPQQPAAPRKPLSLAASSDHGMTWKHVIDVETGRPEMGLAEAQIKTPGREEYSFPTLCQLDDGSILLAYNYRRQTIKVLRFAPGLLASSMQDRTSKDH